MLGLDDPRRLSNGVDMVVRSCMCFWLSLPRGPGRVKSVISTISRARGNGCPFRAAVRGIEGGWGCATARCGALGTDHRNRSRYFIALCASAIEVTVFSHAKMRAGLSPNELFL